jgi:hypothetical protein
MPTPERLDCRSDCPWSPPSAEGSGGVAPTDPWSTIQSPIQSQMLIPFDDMLGNNPA